MPKPAVVCSAAMDTEDLTTLTDAAAEAHAFALEDVTGIAAELAVLAREFAAETSNVLPWRAPDASALIQRQANGYITFTVRCAGALVGFCFVRRSVDGATDAGMYLRPAHRGGFTSVHLARFVMSAMAELGAHWMLWECDEASGSYAIAERLNLEPISRRYLARLTKDFP